MDVVGANFTRCPREVAFETLGLWPGKRCKKTRRILHLVNDRSQIKPDRNH
jgi:hypothetical protein